MQLFALCQGHGAHIGHPRLAIERHVS
jgi:hypothetical protein